MPNSKSAEKRLRQNEARRLRNRSAKSALKTQLAKVHEAIEAGDLSQAEAQFRQAARSLDRAGHTNLIHRNTASRTKSRLQKRIKAAKQKGPA
jgi:small subunit ribosomal protein S20